MSNYLESAVSSLREASSLLKEASQTKVASFDESQKLQLELYKELKKSEYLDSFDKVGKP